MKMRIEVLRKKLDADDERGEKTQKKHR